MTFAQKQNATGRPLSAAQALHRGLAGAGRHAARKNFVNFLNLEAALV
jgi:hypothetical protein